jgi:hypothetical protein
VFVGDAPADPLSGLQAAASARELLESGTSGVIDVSMRDTVAAALSPVRAAHGRYPAHVG